MHTISWLEGDDPLMQLPWLHPPHADRYHLFPELTDDPQPSLCRMTTMSDRDESKTPGGPFCVACAVAGGYLPPQATPVEAALEMVQDPIAKLILERFVAETKGAIDTLEAIAAMPHRHDGGPCPGCAAYRGLHAQRLAHGG